MDAKPLLRIPVQNHPATRKCPNCKTTMFDDNWPRHSIELLLYKPYCPSCGQKLDWIKYVNIGGKE